MAIETLIFKRRFDLEDFIKENRLWEDLYEDLYFNIVDCLKMSFMDEEPDALKIMNDTYCQCLKVLIDKHPGNRLCTKYLKMEFTLNTYTENSMMVLSICYAVLALSNHNNQKNIKSFLKRTKVFFGEGHYIFGKVEKFIETHTCNYDFSLRLEPMPPGEIDYEWGPGVGFFWKDVMDNKISTKNIKEVLSLYQILEDKRRVLKQIGDAIELCDYPKDEHEGYMEAWDELKSQKEGSTELHTDAETSPNDPAVSHSSKNEISCLQEENAKLKEKIRQLESEKCELEAQLHQLQHSAPTCQPESDTLFRNFVESIIEYAEKFPSNQNDKADVIKAMLQAKGFNGYIPEGVLTAELRERIENLGRKETPLPSMFSISGNNEVNIGGNK